MSPRPLRAALVLSPALIVACTQGDEISEDAVPFDGIESSEKITVLGNEPFWNVEINGGIATYTSPEEADGIEFTVSRFAGNNGLGLSGMLIEQPIVIAVTPGACDDGMSEREYPFTATVKWGDQTFTGCGYTDTQPFRGDQNS